MPIYEYTGIDSKGKVVKGVVDADTPQAAHLKLKASKIFITRPLIRSEEKISSERWGLSLYRGPSLKEISLMTYELKTLLEAGLSLPDALEGLITQEENHLLKRALSSVKDAVSQGSSLADALKRHPRIFNPFYISAVSVGEESGNLEGVLGQLCSHMERQEMVRTKVVQALAYPAFMTVIGTVILFFLMTSIVPKVLIVFEGMQGVLPLPTRILIGISNLISSSWYIILLTFVGIIYGIRRFLKTEKGLNLYERFILRIPILGRLFLNLLLYRFSKTMETLLKSGMPLLNAIEISRGTLHHKGIEASLKRVGEELRSGRPLSEILNEEKLFPPAVTQMVAVGEKGGGLEESFARVSALYERSIEKTLGSLLPLIEPTLIVIMGGIVGFIVLSILLPIFEVGQMVR